jgi:hypothetical protein
MSDESEELVSHMKFMEAISTLSALGSIGKWVSGEARFKEDNQDFCNGDDTEETSDSSSSKNKNKRGVEDKAKINDEVISEIEAVLEVDPSSDSESDAESISSTEQKTDKSEKILKILDKVQSPFGILLKSEHLEHTKKSFNYIERGFLAALSSNKKMESNSYACNY